MNGPATPTADTQPAVAHNPAPPPRPVTKRRRARVPWLSLTVIFLTTCTLLLSLALFVAALPSADSAERQRPLQVSVQAAGALRTIETTAATVGDLLKQQALDLPAGATLSHPLEERLSDGMLIRVIPPREVTLVVDGAESSLTTQLQHPQDILAEAGIALSDSDKIWVNGALARADALPAWTVPAHHIRIRRALPLTIIDDGDELTIVTQEETIGEALFAAGITLYLSDEVSPPLDSPITDAATISIKRAAPVELLIDGVVIEARANAATVEAALAQLNAPLFGLDYVIPPGDTPLEPNMRIEIVRVTEEIVAESEPIKHELRYQADPDLELDHRRLVQAGADGEREIRSRVRYENGVEVSREISETVVVKAPMHRIVAYGAAIVPGVVQTAAGPLQYWRRLCVYATRYNPTSNGGNTRTSTGARLQKGVIAAKPQLIPYYTKVYVPGYGRGEILDTGGGLRSTLYWIDLGYSDHDYVHGAGYTYIYLVGAPPADIDYLLPAWAPFSARPGGCG